MRPDDPLNESSSTKAPRDHGQTGDLTDAAASAPAAAASASEARRSKARVLFAHASRLFPWVSLVASVVGAVWMDRRESRAGMVALASAGSWLVLVLLSVIERTASNTAEHGTFRKLLRFSSTAASQSLIQMSLFFSAPFYLEACVWSPLEILFAAVFVVAIAVTLWDPLCDHVLVQPFLGPFLLAFSSFVAWNAALPMLGVAHRVGMWVAAGAVAVAIPLMHIASGAFGTRRLSSIIAGLLIPVLLALGGVRALPPAPLKVVEAGIGTRVENRELVDAQSTMKRAPSALVCWTAIRAPHGLEDQLEHVWRHEGEITMRIQLDVRGGRRAGFRTWSRMLLPRGAHGEYRCEVMTALGQTLGGASVRIAE